MGAEYLELKAPANGYEIPNLPQLKDQEIWYAYETQGNLIHSETYREYNKAFYEAMIAGINIEADFDTFKNTDYWEKYMLNTFQFSAAKSAAEMKMLQSYVFGKNGERVPFEQFKEIVEPIVGQFKEQWLRVEYDLAVHGAVMGQRWNDLYRDRDLFPYWVFTTRKDDRVRKHHEELEGKIFKFDDPYAQQFWPPLDWNCFHGDMLITTHTGLKPIKNIEIGEFILTRNGYKKVLNSWCNGIKKVHKVTFTGESEIHTFYSTDSHKVYTKELGFIEINKLHPNVLYTFVNSDLQEYKAYIYLDLGGFETKVYDLMIDEQPEFFVNKILVHNCRCEGESTDEGTPLNKSEMEKYTGDIGKGFDGNVGIDGIFPKTKSGSSYFNVLPDANKAKPQMFRKP